MANWKTPDAKQVLAADTENTDVEAWLLERRHGTGGSDAATLMGVNRFQSPSEMLREKLSTEPPVDLRSPILDFGHAIEDRLAARLAAEAGIKTRRTGLLRHKVDTYRYANPDRLTSDGGIAEFKSTGRRTEDARTWLEGGAAQHALIQGMHYLGVTGRSHLWFAVAIRNDYAPWENVPRRSWGTDWFADIAVTDWIVVGPIPRDDELIAEMNRRAALFQGCVERGQLDETFTAMLPIDERYPHPNEGAIAEPLIPDMAITDVQRYKAILEQERDLKSEKSEIAERVKETLGNAEVLRIDGQDVATWKGGTRNDLDKAAIEADHPGLLAKYTITKPKRTFAVKGFK